MKKLGKRLIAAAAILAVFTSLFTETSLVLADAPYKTYTVDGYGAVTETQDRKSTRLNSSH